MKKQILFVLVITILISLFMCAYAEEEAQEPAAIEILLNGDSIQCEDSGAVVENTVLFIREPGIYRLSGSLDGGHVVVDCSESENDEDKVVLRLAGVTITSDEGPAIECIKANRRLSIVIEEGTQNELSDVAFDHDEEECRIHDAVIYSKSDLTITGKGTLTVNGNHKNGIESKDDVRVKGDVNLIIKAKRNGINANEDVEFISGCISIECGKDGIKCNGKEDLPEAVFTMYDGTLAIVCGDEPIKTVAGFRIYGGAVDTRIISTNGDD